MVTQADARSPVLAAREALDAHRWQEAFDLLTKADAAQSLEPQDIEALAKAAWFTANADLALQTRERAFRAHLDQGNTVRAAVLAYDVAREYGLRGDASIA